ncbi:unnamed protein product [Mytilus coruscus]|uniref:Uncharacterized protein n=1 Tax=Mytilus coruscus TaxID=42192 RepID=A0A6J8C718_MYTCO|nr:unnamed protein product [Mytilus coruscus]
MYTLSVITLSICLLSIIMIMQGAEAGTCLACGTTFAGAAGKDKETLCSAANAYLECAKEDCTSDSGATVALAEEVKQAACGAEAGACLACGTTFAGAAGKDKETLCSAANAFLECAKEDCTSDSYATVVLAEKNKQVVCGAEAGTCLACGTTFAGAAGKDKETLCSAANAYLECAKEDCTSDSGATVALAEEVKQAACGAEAGTCLACGTTFAGAAGKDKETLCSAANAYLECAKEDCTSDSGATVALAEEVKQAACGAEAGTCLACGTTFAGAAGKDKETLCSAANAYLECAKEDCTSDSGATVALAEEVKQAACGAEAGTCLACGTTFAGAAGKDKETLCSAANAFLECAKEDCTSDSYATVVLAEKAKQAACGIYTKS